MNVHIEHRRHTLAHLLAAAVRELYPYALPTIGPAIDNGFYYDFDFSGGTIPHSDDLVLIQDKMIKLLPSWTEFTHRKVLPAEARDIFAGNQFKIELIDMLEKEGATITLYTCGGFTDLCRGGHSEHPSREISPDSFRLDKIAGAYWRGDEKNPMLTRIYGLAFEDKATLDAYVSNREEALKRDHRILGRELDLFSFSDLVGAGLPLYTPKGTILRDELASFSEGLQKKYGFQKVWIPHITKIDLYKKSGHWDKFGHELMLVKSQESSDEFVLKPMNCPHHTQIYASKPRSYRDLPVRLMETTTCYRDEKTGELSGLTRVRSLTQDDAHVFCRMDQVEQEFENIMTMIKTMYVTLGMQFKARLSFSSAETPEKYLGSKESWALAEASIKKIAEKLALDYVIAPGEAAFYGPKIDIMVVDALGREWQCATQQLDFVQPERFGLEYTDADGSKKTPVMIHKALLGTIDRFLGVYIEHTAGAFPLWMAPVQVKILPVSKKHADYARGILSRLHEAEIRAEMDDSDSLGKRIRASKMEKVPYVLVVGDKEIERLNLTVESRDTGTWDTTPSVQEFITKIHEEIRTRARTQTSR
jgi:threonyl-tRNA synthetase